MAANKRNVSSEELQEQVLAKISQFSDKNRHLAEKMHAIISSAAPHLQARLWYGMPGYAVSKDSAVLLFFREDAGFMTFGFTENVRVAPDDTASDLLIPCAWYFNDIDQPTEASIANIIRSTVE